MDLQKALNNVTKLKMEYAAKHGPEVRFVTLMVVKMSVGQIFFHAVIVAIHHAFHQLLK